MTLWQRLLITIVAIFLASYLAGLIWQAAFDTRLPSFLGGIVGGLSAIPVWGFLERVRSKRKR